MGHPTGLAWDEEWKCWHEAAHCVAAIASSGTVHYVDLDFRSDKQGVAWDKRPGAAFEEVVAIMAAGAAIDRELEKANKARNTDISAKFAATASIGDRAEMRSFARGHGYGPCSDARLDNMFDVGIGLSDTLFSSPQPRVALDALAKHLCGCFTRGDKRASGEDVHSVVEPLLRH